MGALELLEEPRVYEVLLIRAELGLDHLALQFVSQEIGLSIERALEGCEFRVEPMINAASDRPARCGYQGPASAEYP